MCIGLGVDHGVDHGFGLGVDCIVGCRYVSKSRNTGPGGWGWVGIRRRGWGAVD